jgi:hypothetical protein
MEPIFTALASAQEEPSGILSITLRGNDGKIYPIALAPEARNALLGLLVSVVQRDGAPGRIQPMRLNSLKIATDSQIAPVLELSLEGLPLVVTLDPNGIPALRAALAQLDQIVSAHTRELH